MNNKSVNCCQMFTVFYALFFSCKFDYPTSSTLYTLPPPQPQPQSNHHPTTTTTLRSRMRRVRKYLTPTHGLTSHCHTVSRTWSNTRENTRLELKKEHLKQVIRRSTDHKTVSYVRVGILRSDIVKSTLKWSSYVYTWILLEEVTWYRLLKTEIQLSRACQYLYPKHHNFLKY